MATRCYILTSFFSQDKKELVTLSTPNHQKEMKAINIKQHSELQKSVSNIICFELITQTGLRPA